MEIKLFKVQSRFLQATKNPLLLIRVAVWSIAIGIIVFLGFSFYRTIYSTVLSPKPVAESQLTSKQATLDTTTLDVVAQALEQQQAKTAPIVQRDLFFP